MDIIDVYPLLSQARNEIKVLNYAHGAVIYGLHLSTASCACRTRICLIWPFCEMMYGLKVRDYDRVGAW